MTDSTHWMAEVHSLAQLRDELRLKAHLLGAELRDDWKGLEEEWERVNHELEPLRRAAGDSAQEIGVAAKGLLRSLRSGYERLRDAVS